MKWQKNLLDSIRFTTNKEEAKEEEFNNYVTNSKNASLYNIEATAKYGDQLLTLSTCEYS